MINFIVINQVIFNFPSKLRNKLDSKKPEEKIVKTNTAVLFNQIFINIMCIVFANEVSFCLSDFGR